MNQFEVSHFLQRAADKLGYNREFFAEKDIPKDTSDIRVLVCLWDVRSLSIFSSLIFNQLRKIENKYIIMVGWPGFKALFPNVNEFWSLKSLSEYRALALGASDGSNRSDALLPLVRGLNYYFEDVQEEAVLDYFDNGLTERYFREFKNIHKFLPNIQSLNSQFQSQINNKKKCVILFPSIKINLWRARVLEKIDISKDFWLYLCKRLLKEGYTPFLYQNQFTYDLSPELTDQCLYMGAEKLEQILAIFNQVGLSIDIFSGISKFALIARCAAIVVDQHLRYVDQKDYQFDSLMQTNQVKNIYSFPLTASQGDEESWRVGFVDNLLNNLKEIDNSSDVKFLNTNTIEEEIQFSDLGDFKLNKFSLKMFKKT